MSVLGRLAALINTKRTRLGDTNYALKRVILNRVGSDNSEEWMDTALSAALAAKSGAFVDVGTNVGQTLLRLLSIDAGRDYVGFEPQLDCVFFVEQFIQQNRLAGKTVIPIGLSNRTGIVRLLKRATAASDVTATIVEGFRPATFYTASQPIYVARGDDMLAEIGVPDISTIKIDVEGAELEVIDGLQTTMRAYTPFVFFEVLNHFLAFTGEKTDERVTAFREDRLRVMESMLHGMGYAIFNVLPGNVVREVVTIQPATSGDMTGTNYLAAHAAYRAAFHAALGSASAP